MNYWITTHWSLRIDVGESFTGTGVWLPDGRQQAADDTRAGDYILVYETKSGRTEIRRFQDGTTTEVPCKPGREVLICYGKIESPVSAIPGSSRNKGGAIRSNLHNSITTVVFLSLLFLFVYCRLNNEDCDPMLCQRIHVVWLFNAHK